MIADTCAPSDHALGIVLACPLCRRPLAIARDTATCAACGETFSRVRGVWNFLPAGRAAAFAPFLRDYQHVRAREGWGGEDAAYYLSLPTVAADDPQRAIWRCRASSYAACQARVLAPLAASRHQLTILDLGAGNGWLCHRLAGAGRAIVAVDISLSASDGLAACARYGGAGLLPVRAEFDRLPIADGQADLAIFNASLHYAAVCQPTLREALRVLRPDGLIVVMDSPVYDDSASGERMTQERDERFRRQLGIVQSATQTEGFLTWERLAALADDLHLEWRVIWPVPGWRRAFSRWKSRLRGQREPAGFPILVGSRVPVKPIAIPNPHLFWRSVWDGYRSVTPPKHRGATPPPARPRALRTIGRWLGGWRFRLFQRHRHGQLVLEQGGPWPLIVLPDVFNPYLLRTGAWLAQLASGGLIPAGASVLDMGTGTGIGAIAVSRQAHHVVAVDCNPEAVRCARINVLLNTRGARIVVREGDLFGPVRGERFDVVLFNPPFFRGEPRDRWDLAWRSPDVVERFAAALPQHLAPAGYALVVLSSDGDAPSFLRAFREAGLAVEEVAVRRILNETLTLYRLSTGTRP